MTGATAPRLDEGGLARARAEARVVLAWFTTSWCGPCRWLGPILEEFAAEHADRLRLVAVDGDESPELCHQIGLRGFPTLVLFSRGNRVWQWKGAPDGDAETVTAAVLSLLDRLDELDPREDRGPRVPAARPARTVHVPAHDADKVTVRICSVDDEGHEPHCPSGPVEVPAGHLVEVSLNADYRDRPPLDLGVLAAFEPGAIDRLAIRYEDLAPTDLAGLASLEQVSEVRLWCGPHVSPDLIEAVLALPRLASLDLNGALVTPEADAVVVNGSWALPGLRGVAPAFTPVGSDDAPPLTFGRTARATSLEATPGVSVLCFTHVWHYAHEPLGRALAAFADASPEVPVLVVDTEADAGLAATLGITPELVPSVAVWRDDRPVWLSARVTEDDDLEALLRARVEQAQAGQVGSRLRLPRTARRHRTLLLPEELGSFELLLAPPGRSVSMATYLHTGGVIEVPDGWQTRARVSLSDDDRDAAGWAVLSACGPDDLDILFVLSAGGGPSAAVAAAEALTGLSTLVLDAEHLDDASVESLSALTWLSQLWVPEGDGTRLDRLRTALPGTIINGEWKALHR